MVVMKNRTTLKGEFEKMQLASVYFDEEVVGDVKLDYEDIIKIKAIQGLYEVELLDGGYRLGLLDSTSAKRMLVIKSYTGAADTIPFGTVYSIAKLEQTFWKRFYGSISLGGSYTKSSDIGRVNFDMNVSYQQSKVITNLSSSISITAQNKERSDDRMNVDLSVSRLFKNRWRATGLTGFSRNTELNLGGRMTLSALVGRNLNKKYYTDFVIYTGLAANSEWDLEREGQPLQFEVPFRIRYQLLEVGNSNIEFYVENNFYLGLSKERYRNKFDFNMNFEIIKDLDLLITLYSDYDSRPPTTESSAIDYGTTLSIKWSF